jgi:hypothetical protein
MEEKKLKRARKETGRVFSIRGRRIKKKMQKKRGGGKTSGQVCWRTSRDKVN